MLSWKGNDGSKESESAGALFPRWTGCVDRKVMEGGDIKGKERNEEGRKRRAAVACEGRMQHVLIKCE